MFPEIARSDSEAYRKTLEYLFSRVPSWQQIGEGAFHPGLSVIEDLCRKLGDPQKKFRSIHVAGTNGKGSVSSMLASILSEAGYRTGLYTSPHLLSFRERIRINGKEVPPQWIVDFVDAARQMIEETDPSFFELTVAMAFDFFAEQEADVAVVEVGLGGRLDATNIISPDLCVITRISFDHQAILGNSLAEIAGEKAGIIKPGIPVVISSRNPETDPVFISAAESNGSVVFFSQDQFRYKRTGGDFLAQDFKRVLKSPCPDGVLNLSLGLSGHYQAENLGAVMQAVELLKKMEYQIPDEAILAGLEKVVPNTGLRGRMEVLREAPLTICDIAHNEDGVRVVMEQLEMIPRRKLHLIWGMVADKDHASILRLLPEEAICYFVRPELPRALDVKLLLGKAEKVGLKGNVYPSVRQGIWAAFAAAGPDDLVFIGGSTFVVAEALAAIGEEKT
jgi:dihydrofolate synthase/folylpolyglutamate synthase